MKIIGWLVLAIIPAYFVACTGISARKSRAYDSIGFRDTRTAVIDAFGAPDVVEVPGKPFLRYATRPCGACAERLWFENGLTFGIEAWSVELDREGRVLETAHWVSP